MSEVVLKFKPLESTSLLALIRLLGLTPAPSLDRLSRLNYVLLTEHGLLLLQERRQ